MNYKVVTTGGYSLRLPKGGQGLAVTSSRLSDFTGGDSCG